MTAPAPFSRSQLAAALLSVSPNSCALFCELTLAALECDDDPLNPDCPFSSTGNSVIFPRFRQQKKERTDIVIPRSSADHLPVKLPGDRGSTPGHEPIYGGHGSRRSHASIDMLRSPFSHTKEDAEEEQGNMDDPDLEPCVPGELHGVEGKEKGSKRESNDRFPKTHETQQFKGPFSPGFGPRAISMGNFDNTGFDGIIVRDPPVDPRTRAGIGSLEERKGRASFGPPPDLVDMNAPGTYPDKAHRKYANGIFETVPEPIKSSSNTLPFPPSVPHWVGDAGIPHRERTYSSASQISCPQVAFDGPGQRSQTQNALPPSPAVWDGPQLSHDGPPLPANARTVRKSVSLKVFPSPDPLTSNSRPTFSIARLTSCSGLHSQDTSYSKNVGVSRATNGGGQARFPSSEPEEIPVIAAPPNEKSRRGSGKLSGENIIDGLKTRKVKQRGKRRYFTF